MFVYMWSVFNIAFTNITDMFAKALRKFVLYRYAFCDVIEITSHKRAHLNRM